MQTTQEPIESFFGEVIYSYTRAQALEDGVLVDVTTEAADFGFRYPTAISSAVFEAVQEIPEGSGHTTLGRLRDVLFMAHRAIKKAKESDGSRLAFQLYLDGVMEELTELYIDFGPGDEGEPVLTIGFLTDF